VSLTLRGGTIYAMLAGVPVAIGRVPKEIVIEITDDEKRQRDQVVLTAGGTITLDLSVETIRLLRGRPIKVTCTYPYNNPRHPHAPRSKGERKRNKHNRWR
jgi:hypothetical protein